MVWQAEEGLGLGVGIFKLVVEKLTDNLDVVGVKGLAVSSTIWISEVINSMNVCPVFEETVPIEKEASSNEPFGVVSVGEAAMTITAFP